MTESQATTQRWVAAHDSANQAARAFLNLTVRRRRWWVFVAGVELMFAILIGIALDDRYGPVTRVVWGCVYGLVPAMAVCGVGLGVGHLMNRRRFRQRLDEGVVLESVIGEHDLLLRGPWAASTISFDGVASLRTSGNWVFLQQVGSPLQSAWPAELFPSDDLDRLQRSVATRRA